MKKSSAKHGTRKNRRKPTGRIFTLVELLVVISIIAILASLLLPALNKAKTKARDIQCRTQIRSLGQASHMYANDYNDYMPGQPVSGTGGFDYFLDTLNYMKTKTGTFTCPMTQTGEVNYPYSWRQRPDGSYSVVNLCIAFAWGYRVASPPKLTSIKLPGKMFFIGDARASIDNAYIYYYGIAYLAGTGITTRHNGKYNFMMLSGDIQQRNDIAGAEACTVY